VRAAGGQPPAATRPFRKGLAQNPNDYLLHFNLGGLLWFDRQKPADAIAELLRSRALNPLHGPTHGVLGMVQRNIGHLRKALRSLQRAHELDPHESIWVQERGLVHRAMGNPRAALQSFREAYRINPKHANNLYELGRELYWSGRIDKGIQILHELIDVDPEYPDAHVALGDALDRKGEHRAAIAEFQKALDQDPNVKYVHLNLGLVHRKLGELEKSKQHLEIAVERLGDFAPAYNELGQTLLELHEHERAVQVLERARDLDSRRAIRWNNYAFSLRVAGRYEKAIEVAREMERRFPRFSWAIQTRAECLENAGRFGEALAAWTRLRTRIASDRERVEQVEASLARCRRLIELDERLPAVLAGRESGADASELFELADVCDWKGKHVAAARLYERAMAEVGEIRTVERASRFFGAATSAMQACNDHELDDEARARWRRLAIDWLRAGVQQTSNLAQPGNDGTARILRELRHVLHDPRFDAIRDPAKLTNLPQSQRTASTATWGGLRALIGRLTH